jgi:hypothetical protein
MAHTYMLFDFGADEEKAQQARHKLEGWKQAFRLDKKLQVKFDRDESSEPEPANSAPPSEKAEKSRTKSTSKTRTKTSDHTSHDDNGDVKLLVRLYFSAHEKLSEQQSVERILADDLFKNASPKTVHQHDKDFAALDQRFEILD